MNTPIIPEAYLPPLLLYCRDVILLSLSFLVLTRPEKDLLYWHALTQAYPCADNLYAYSTDMKVAFSCDYHEREYLMNKEDREFLARPPNQIQIY